MKTNSISDFIFNETGIRISTHLQSLIEHPEKLNKVRYSDLEKIVREFAPIYKKYRLVLDKPTQWYPIIFFGIGLMLKLKNKPELQKILEI